MCPGYQLGENLSTGEPTPYKRVSWPEELEKYLYHPGTKVKTIKGLLTLKVRLRIKACLSSNPTSTSSYLRTQGVTSGWPVE